MICRALATSLRCVRSSSGSRPVELLRKESLAGLAPAAAARVLSHAYAAVVPIAPLPYPPLPLAPNRPGKHPLLMNTEPRADVIMPLHDCSHCILVNGMHVFATIPGVDSRLGVSSPDLANADAENLSNGGSATCG